MKHLIRLGIALQLVFLLFLVKAVWFTSAQFTLKSPSLNYIKKEASSAAKKDAADTLSPQLKTKADSVAQKKATFERLFPHTPNDTVKRVLLIGDSQLENIRNPIRKRLMDNNYQLVASVIWYGSSTKQWANSDTLAYYVAKYKPDFVLIALGLNELFVNDLDKRTAYAGQIKRKLEVAQMPYYFIGPAAWVKDKGITAVLQNTFGELFYPSHLLTLERAADGRHPSKNGGVKWIEQVAKQISSKGILNLAVVKDTSYAGTSPTILLKVPKE